MPKAPAPPSATIGPVDLLLYAATILIFGSGWLPLRMQLGVVVPEVSLVWRFLIATVVMFIVVAVRGERLLFHWRDHLVFAVLGVTLFSLNFITFYYAGYHLPSGLLSVVFALAAVMIPLIGAAVLGQPLHRQVVAGAVVGVAGLALVFGPTLASGEGVEGAGVGLLLSLAGTFCFSVGSLVSGLAGRRGYPLVSMTAWGFFYGFAIMLVVAILRGAPFTIDWTARYVGSLLYLVAAQTLSGFAIYFALIRRIGASRAGYVTVLFPLVALALSTWFEAFHWTLGAALGIALVLTGALLVLLPRRDGAPAR
ncbi:DMT family transporter [Xanthobacter agilis]|uniref:Drug/metabolite transporter (DMT)-like permease n=1 Tax=Xanthobacter agilis TaxID=47492 RepID=A0ABU0LBJ7_XANAG|nr:DMT family transporter [Xanthobacter agilis]MDQ0504515.1 drug/metabolite transporter (DMT)-like permease [Xanthobacter agilis]